MKFINKVEIKYFRSFADNPTYIYNLKDINIFSGGNDSGKSNVLRALNLFFNEQISYGIPFILDRDFSKIKLKLIDQEYDEKKIKNKDKEGQIRKSSQFVEVKIHFNLQEKEKGMLPSDFWISKRWTYNNQLVINSNIETRYIQEHEEEMKNLEAKGEKKKRQNKLNALKARQTEFLKKIDFFYVPAIKDYFFFKALYSKLQEKLQEASRKKIKKSSEDLQKTIRDETGKFFDKFKNSTGLDARFLLEESMLDFTKNIEVETEKDILLTSRGDGIQARLIPDILEELSKNKKYIIWGFEEPENSYEYKKSIELAKQFYDKYSVIAQLFLTTHSNEFLSIKDPDNIKEKDKKVSIYRIYKGMDGGTKIAYYDEKKGGFDKEQIKGDLTSNNEINENALKSIYSDLGIIEESRIISDLEDKIKELNLENSDLKNFKIQFKGLFEEFKKIKEEKELIEKELNKYKDTKIIVFCENKNADDLNSLGFKNIKFLPSDSKIYAFDSAKEKGCGVFSLIDRDFLTDKEKEYIETNTNVRLFDFYCFENYLYHPENLQEYCSNKTINFDIILYTQNIIEEFKNFNITDIGSGRQSYKKITDYTKKVYDSSELNNYNKKNGL